MRGKQYKVIRSASLQPSKLYLQETAKINNFNQANHFFTIFLNKQKCSYKISKTIFLENTEHFTLNFDRPVKFFSKIFCQQLFPPMQPEITKLK